MCKHLSRSVVAKQSEVQNVTKIYSALDYNDATVNMYMVRNIYILFEKEVNLHIFIFS